MRTYFPRHSATSLARRLDTAAPKVLATAHRGRIGVAVGVVAVTGLVALASAGSIPSGADTQSATWHGFDTGHRSRHVAAPRALAAPLDASVGDLRGSQRPVTRHTLLDPAAHAPKPSGRTTRTGQDVTTSSASVSSLTSGGIPVTALKAYKSAANAMTVADPNCHIPWPLLAGIGRVESDHGRFAGAQLLTDGTSTVKILGPVLNGHGTAVITDTDGGALDGNAIYDRAMGPMQFIPSTWSEYASDGNGDGVDDPFNIFDAAQATAKYLCAAGGDLATSAGQERAVFSYNHLDSYVNEVLGLERAYAAGAGVVVPDGPVDTHGTTAGGTSATGGSAPAARDRHRHVTVTTSHRHRPTAPVAKAPHTPRVATPTGGATPVTRHPTTPKHPATPATGKHSAPVGGAKGTPTPPSNPLKNKPGPTCPAGSHPAPTPAGGRPSGTPTGTSTLGNASTAEVSGSAATTTSSVSTSTSSSQPPTSSGSTRQILPVGCVADPVAHTTG